MPVVTKQARQGDILFIKVAELPEKVKEVKDGIVAHGEVTGHAHRLEVGGGVALLEEEGGDGTTKFVTADKEWKVKHDEHGAIDFAPGIWEARRQREYSPEEIKIVAD